MINFYLSRWQHGHCEGLYTDEQLEQAATNRMRCSACRPNRSNAGFFDAETVVVCDNVALNKTSDEILKSKYTPSALRHHMMETYGRESFDHCELINFFLNLQVFFQTMKTTLQTTRRIL